MTIPQTAQEFAHAINAHNVERIIKLMSSDHVFIDSLGNEATRPGIEAGWRHYFAVVPDYWIKVKQLVRNGNTVILIGKAGGTYVPKGGKMTPENKWETTAAWRAIIKGGKISEWQIYCDNEPIREKMRAGDQ